MKKLVVITFIVALVGAAPASAHLRAKHDGHSLKAKMESQRKNLAHAMGVKRVCERLDIDNAECRWHRSAVRWLARELNETRDAMERAKASRWIANMIAAAEYVANHSSGDPWPNCPDPGDGGGYSWYDTKNCESGGYSWYVDPPGYYCGPFQMDPYTWRVPIARYGVPC